LERGLVVCNRLLADDGNIKVLNLQFLVEYLQDPGTSLESVAQIEKRVLKVFVAACSFEYGAEEDGRIVIESLRRVVYALWKLGRGVPFETMLL
jgi:uncharacterized protein YoxC